MVAVVEVTVSVVPAVVILASVSNQNNKNNNDFLCFPEL